MRQSSFTMIELIMVLVITGILNGVIGPKFLETGFFNSRGFHDETLALLRFVTILKLISDCRFNTTPYTPA